MQSISPLTVTDFKDKSNIVIGKVEIDTDGAGTYEELPDVIDFGINTNIENQVGRLSSYSFSMTVLNTDNQYHPYNTGSSYYNYLRQGRRIKLYAGLKVGGTEKYFQWLIGRVDDYRLAEQAGQDICTITGRDFMRVITDYRLYSPNTHWGTDHTYNTVANQIRYDMEADCEGIYKVELDYTNKDGTALEEIFENTDWTYDWHNNKLIFTAQRIPDFAGTDNLKVYYFQTQSVEDVVGHILYVAGIFANTAERDNWIADTDYVTPTNKTIDRVWLNTGTSALEAIRLLSEVVQYRLHFNYEGNPVFKPKTSIGTAVDSIKKSDMTVKNIEENEEETYTHIIVLGEERDRIIGEDEIAPAVPTGLTLSTGLGLPTQASLSWIEAEWDANTESDFGHYELRIRKTAYSYYTEVSTIGITFIWHGLEPGVEYNVIIRAVDIYNNRSDWSTEETIVTATDGTTPVQITGVVATAIFAGVKIEWGIATEDNIAGYIVERQESPDNVDWTGGWTERIRLRATMWLDLMLTYSKWYRYRITAYTQAGVEGVTSSISDAVQPKQAETIDIEALAITATKLAEDAVTEGKIAANAVTEGKIIANAVVSDKIAANAIVSDKIAALAIITDKLAASAITTVKIKAGAVTTDCIAANAVTAVKIYANTITANEIAAGTITSSEIASYTITTTQLNFVPVKSTDVIARINASAEGIRIDADNIYITGLTTFASGYNPTQKVPTSGAANDVNTYTTTINGAKITTGTIVALGNVTAGSFQVSSAGYIRTVGKTYYTDTTAGFWLGYDAGYKLNIGSSSQYLKWSGSALSIKGSITLINTIPNTKVDGLGDLALEDDIAYGDITGAKPPINADVTLSAINGELNITGGGLVLYSAGAKIRGGKTSYTSTTAGFWLGDVSGVSKLSIGSSTNYLKWTGSALQIKGRLSVGSGTNEDIYFEDSAIRMYDAVSGSYKRIYWRYSTLDFARLTYYTSGNATSLHLNTSNKTLSIIIQPERAWIATGDEFLINVKYSYNNFIFHSGGPLELPVLVSAPTGHTGDLTHKSGYYNSFRWYSYDRWMKATFTDQGW